MLTAWLAAGPAVALAVALLTVPGAVVARAAGLRGIPVLGLAAPLSVTVTSLTAVLAPMVGVRWGVPPVAAATVLAAVVAWFAGRAADTRVHRDPRGLVLASAAAVVVGGLLGGVAMARGIGLPDRVPQTYDAVFHLNAAHRALVTGDASSLTLGTIISPDRRFAFYPAAWHGLAALVATISGVTIPVAASAVAVATSLVWPAGCLLLARQALGPRLLALQGSAALACGFAALPFLLNGYGTLWPNALATVLLPSPLAAALSLLGLARHDVIGPRRSWWLGTLTIPGLVLCHPNVLVTLVVYSVPLTGAALARWLGRARPSRPRAGAAIAVWAALGATILWLLARSPFFAAVRRTDWPARESLPQAVGEAIFVAPRGVPVSFVLAGLSVLGLMAAVRRPRLWWLLGCHLVGVGLFSLAAGSDSRLSQALTGPWYNDAFRLGGLLPVTGVILVAVALDQGARVPSMLGAARVAGVLRRGDARPYLVSAACVAALLLATQGAGQSANARVVTSFYGGSTLVGPGERQLLSRLPSLVPAGQVVAGNPWNGSSLTEALGDRQALFPHLGGSWGADRQLVAGRLRLAAYDPSVCPAVRRLHLAYVLDGRSTFWTGDPRQHLYDGLSVNAARGFERVASGGRLTLYRITVCGST